MQQNIKNIEVIFDGVVKSLHLVRCYNFPIITTYRMYAEIIGKLHASNMNLFTYPSKLRFLRTCHLSLNDTTSGNISLSVEE